MTFEEVAAQLVDALPSAEIVGGWQGVVDAAKTHILSLTKENVALRREVNALRAKCGMERKYVEYGERD